ncbi:hypothetical protein, partial [Rubrimonas sp.]|uniref:hypothetical protein n=1 Tax=Rubrimonas sp. TaxID=2036015 RepID=UPI002FDDE00D
MNAILLRILRHDARAWYGEAGDPDAIRRAVRWGAATVRHALASPGGHVWIAPHGVAVHYTRPGYGDCRLQACTLPTCGTALAAIVAGVP